MMHRTPPLRVLVVDDDLETAEELAELLEAHRLRAIVARDLVQALAIAQAERPDIALIDLELGAASGVDLAVHWHGQPGAPAVILLSGRTLTAAECARLPQPPPVLLRKPMAIPELLETLDKMAT